MLAGTHYIHIFTVMTKSQSTSYAFKTRPTVADTLEPNILSIIERCLLLEVMMYCHMLVHCKVSFIHGGVFYSENPLLEVPMSGVIIECHSDI